MANILKYAKNTFWVLCEISYVIWMVLTVLSIAICFAFAVSFVFHGQATVGLILLVIGVLALYGYWDLWQRYRRHNSVVLKLIGLSGKNSI